MDIMKVDWVKSLFLTFELRRCTVASLLQILAVRQHFPDHVTDLTDHYFAFSGNSSTTQAKCSVY